MLSGLSHYVLASLIGQTQAILTGYTSATGNPQTVTIYRADPATLPGPPPHIWFEGSAWAEDPTIPVLGDTLGIDSSGNQQYGMVQQGTLIDFGLRCELATERDDLFDALWQCFRGAGINPATGNRWIVDINIATGVVIHGVGGRRFAKAEGTQYGVLWEASASLQIASVAVNSANQALIAGINIDPVEVTLNVPTQ